MGSGSLGDDSKTALGGPAEEDLGRIPVVLGGDLLDGLIFDEGSELRSVLHVEFEEAGRAERAVGSDGDSFPLGEVEELLLDEVRVVLDLEGGRADAGVAEEIIDQLSLEVGDTDAAGEAGIDELLHGGPGLLDGGLGGDNLIVLIVPAGGVADGRVDVLEGDGEMDEIEIEVIEAPVGELLLDDGLDAVAFVEGVPELGDDEELLTLHEAILDSTGNTLTAFPLVAVVCCPDTVVSFMLLPKTISFSRAQIPRSPDRGEGRLGATQLPPLHTPNLIPRWGRGRKEGAG